MLWQRLIFVTLILLMALVQQGLWSGKNGYGKTIRIQRAIEQQQLKNLQLSEQNHLLEIEVDDLKNGYEVIEEKARYDLGFIKRGETFYMLDTRPR